MGVGFAPGSRLFGSDGGYNGRRAVNCPTGDSEGQTSPLTSVFRSLWRKVYRPPSTIADISTAEDASAATERSSAVRAVSPRQPGLAYPQTGTRVPPSANSQKEACGLCV